MIKVYRLFLLILSVASTAYVLLRNWEPATVFFSPTLNFSAPIGLIVIIFFLLGVVVTALWTLGITLRHYFLRKKLEERIVNVGESNRVYAEGRESLILLDDLKAKRLFARALSLDPYNLAARLALFECYLKEKDFVAAGSVLDFVDENARVSLLESRVRIEEVAKNDTALFDRLRALIEVAPSISGLRKLVEVGARVNKSVEAQEVVISFSKSKFLPQEILEELLSKELLAKVN